MGTSLITKKEEEQKAQGTTWDDKGHKGPIHKHQTVSGEGKKTTQNQKKALSPIWQGHQHRSLLHGSRVSPSLGEFVR